MRSLTALLLLPLVLARSYTQQQPLQVYLHPTPAESSNAKAIPTLTAAQAKAVLSPHLGEGVSDFEEVPGDVSVWGHLVGTFHNWVHPSADKDEQARVVIIEGVDAQEVLPTSLPQSPSFYLHSHESTNLLAPYYYRAKHLLDHILDNLPEILKGWKDAFEMAGTKAAEALGHELSCLTAMADNLSWNKGSASAYEAIRISGFKQVDKGSEVWETGRAGVQAGLQSMTKPSSPPLLVIIVPPSQHHKRALSALTASNTSAATGGLCFASNSTCSDSTNCYGRGVCSLLTKTDNSECWGCKCAPGFAGAECQKADYSVPFVILIFSTLLLVFMLVGSVALLFSVGETKLPSTLTLAVGRSK